MARRRTNMPRNAGPGGRDDEPSEADLEQFGGVTRTCPECGTECYDDAEVCWKCGRVFMGGDQKPSRAAWWVIGVIALLILAMTVIQIVL